MTGTDGPVVPERAGTIEVVHAKIDRIGCAKRFRYLCRMVVRR